MVDVPSAQWCGRGELTKHRVAKQLRTLTGSVRRIYLTGLGDGEHWLVVWASGKVLHGAAFMGDLALKAITEIVGLLCRCVTLSSLELCDSFDSFCIFNLNATLFKHATVQW